jgi:hypothetical protein
MVMIQTLVELGYISWNNEKVPAEWQDGSVIKLPKKGDHQQL